MYDWSSGHHCFDDDALNANKLNAGPGGKQPRMHDTTIPVAECGPKTRNLTAVAGSAPPRLAQSFIFAEGDVLLIEKAERVLKEGDPLIGVTKGAMQIARERDVYAKGMSMKGPIIKEPTAEQRAACDDDGADGDGDDDDEEKGVVRNLELSVVHVLSQMSDVSGGCCRSNAAAA